MSYLVLARKYRPQSFEDLVGQEHVARTLANAIDTNRVAHAFLFTGVRGVGKTTSARLLAKCLNCLGKDGKATGPTAAPCQECAACKEIAAGNDMDVQEIDGASYNGVDEVRRLQEGLAFRPARDRFKVYIVDEVHMLSNAAWNAFLKTLEEPPPHVKFIFATTEVHKVPATILSRCQRYDFKLISVAMIIARLKEVLAKESIKADDASLSIIAREAAGSMRDAMSLLDQVIAFSGQELKGQDVARVLGVADGDALLGLAKAVLSGDKDAALRLTHDLAESGFDLVHLGRHLLRQFRDLVVVRSAKNPDGLIDRTKEDIAALSALASTVAEGELLRVFSGFSKSFEEIARSAQPRMSLEMALVRLASRPTLHSVDELLGKLAALEARLGGAPSGGSASGGSSSGGSSSGGGGGGGPAPQPVAQRPAPAPKGPSRGGARTEAEEHFASLAPPPPPRFEQQASNGAPSSQRPPARVPVRSTDEEAWRNIVARVRAEKPGLAALFDHAAPSRITPTELVLAYVEEDFLASQVTTEEARSVLTAHARAFFGVATEVRIDLRRAPEASIFEVDQEKKREASAKVRKEVEDHPLVQELVHHLGCELRSVKVPGE